MRNSPKVAKVARTPARRIPHCAVCGSIFHTRSAHGWTGKNMTDAHARALANARKHSTQS